MCTSDQTLDMAQLESLSALQGDDQQDLVATMIDLFIDEAARRIADAEVALRNRDLVVLCRSAHSLRGACGVVGAQRLGGLAGTLEHADPSMSDAEKLDMLAAMATEFARVQLLLRPYLTKALKGQR